MPSNANLLAAFDLQWFSDNLLLVIGVAIVVVGLAIFGISDLLRFSVKRILAISGVCYQESIRRRILWIIPLAIIGLVIVVQLQQPVDEQDAIRQTTKFCLFATGMVVVISTIILACSNLPREIENRVIFTVVSKPTTRLEIILGKITGFARVSATILLIMGVFSYGYLILRAWGLQRDLRYRLQQNAVETVSRPTFQHYVDAGLLNAKRMADPNAMNIFGKMPGLLSNRRYPTPDGKILVPFHLPEDMWAVVDPDGTQHPNNSYGIRISVRLGFDAAPPPARPNSAAAPPGPPRVSVEVMDQNANSAVSAELKNNPAVIPSADGSQSAYIDVPINQAAALAKFPNIFIALTPAGGSGNLWIDEDTKNPPVQLIVPVVSGDLNHPPAIFPSDPSDASRPGGFVFTGREGVIGQQLKGDPQGASQVGLFTCRGLKVDPRQGNRIPIEFRVGVEKSGDVHDEDTSTIATLTVINGQTGKVSDPVTVMPENNRPFYASLPADAIAGGNFSVVVRCLSADQWLNLKRSSLSIVLSDESFALNLLKSLTVLWLLSVLVIAISVFCSTFLSWPIAVVLTLVMLLGRWGVNQLGDAASAGVGRQIAQDFQVTDPTKAMALSGTVEELNKGMKAVAAVLPDIEQFAVTQDIDRGISIPLETLASGAWVLFAFGVPLTVLAFVIFKNKEVAP